MHHGGAIFWIFVMPWSFLAILGSTDGQSCPYQDAQESGPVWQVLVTLFTLLTFHCVLLLYLVTCTARTTDLMTKLMVPFDSPWSITSEMSFGSCETAQV